MLVFILITAVAPVPPVLAAAGSGSLYRHAYECVKLLEGGVYEIGGSGGDRNFIYQSPDLIFQPGSDDHMEYYDLITGFMHMVCTGSPVYFEAAYRYEEDDWSGLFRFEMLVPATAERMREARNKARVVVDRVIGSGMGAREKYYALYEWMTYNIRYNEEAARYGLVDGSESVSASFIAGQGFESALIDGLAVCGGIGRAYMLLCQLAELPVLYITGNSMADHAWNKIFIDGKWLNVDVTDACANYSVDAGYFAVEDSILSGSRYTPYLRDYTNIVPYLYPNLDQFASSQEKAPVQAPAPTDPQQPDPPETSANGIKVTIDSRPVVFDVLPQIDNGRVLVPLRVIFSELGAQVDWDGDTQTVTAVKDGVVVILTIGNTSPTVNGETVVIDQPGVIVYGRTLAPLRFVAEAFGGTVEWDGVSQTAAITGFRE